MTKKKNFIYWQGKGPKTRRGAGEKQQLEYFPTPGKSCIV